MKDYLYYPGCSLTGTAREYDLSVRALAGRLGMALTEIEDWTCCGATAAQAVDTGLAAALSARNLALAANTSPESCPEGGGQSNKKVPPEILVPCSACYLNLKTAAVQLETDKKLRASVEYLMAGEGLELRSGMTVRHLLDVLSTDIDWDGSGEAVPEMGVFLEGMVVAAYYGCQCLRPFRVFDDPEDPHSMDAMIRATGARVLDWDMGGECCGASHGTTKPAAGRRLTEKILSAAQKAHCIVTVCPMCQMNLEIFQSRDHPIPILYLPQFLGLAMGIATERLGLDLNLTDCRALAGG